MSDPAQVLAISLEKVLGWSPFEGRADCLNPGFQVPMGHLHFKAPGVTFSVTERVTRDSRGRGAMVTQGEKHSKGFKLEDTSLAPTSRDQIPV